MEDIFIAHIGGADTFAKGLLIADAVIKHSKYEELLTKRYASFDSGKGAEFLAGKLNLTDLYEIAMTKGEPEQISGKQELYENILNQFL